MKIDNNSDCILNTSQTTIEISEINCVIKKAVKQFRCKGNDTITGFKNRVDNYSPVEKLEEERDIFTRDI
ncbi:MAG TPA: hypothetical protein VN372_01095 [Methanospirillum sp.]|nr:hypothetical protein [Methanospirillum sp.]